MDDVNSLSREATGGNELTALEPGAPGQTFPRLLSKPVELCQKCGLQSHLLASAWNGPAERKRWICGQCLAWSSPDCLQRFWGLLTVPVFQGSSPLPIVGPYFKVVNKKHAEKCDPSPVVRSFIPTHFITLNEKCSSRKIHEKGRGLRVTTGDGQIKALCHQVFSFFFFFQEN